MHLINPAHIQAQSYPFKKEVTLFCPTLGIKQTSDMFVFHVVIFRHILVIASVLKYKKYNIGHHRGYKIFQHVKNNNIYLEYILVLISFKICMKVATGILAGQKPKGSIKHLCNVLLLINGKC